MKISPNRQSGATLIEALVALLIFAIGVVGIAGLMAAAVRYQTGNEARLRVTTAFNELAERIRVNAPGANGYTGIVDGVAITGVGYQLQQTYADQVAADAASYEVDCSTTKCTPAQLATYDQAQWSNLLRASLPGGAGYVTGDVLNGFNVTVMWFDKAAVDSKDEALGNLKCTNAAADDLLAKARFCCPDDAKAPAGVRCYTAKVIP